MPRIRSLLAVGAALVASILPLQPSRAFATASSCPDVSGVHLVAPFPSGQHGATSGIPWLKGGQQLQAIVDLTYDFCTPGYVPPGLGVLVSLLSSNPSVASVPGGVMVPLGVTSGAFTITTYTPASASAATITAILNTPARIAMVVLASRPGYTVTDLGSLPGARTTAPHAINNQGTMVGASGAYEGTNAHAFSSNGNPPLKDLGAIPGNIYGSANGINNAGAIVGTSANIQQGSVITERAVTWQNGQISDLGTPAIDFTSANAINNLGHIVGSFRPPDSFVERPFIWTAGGGMQELAQYGFSDNVATSVNDFDRVVGVGDSNPVIWTGLGSPQDLVTPLQLQAMLQGGNGGVPNPVINNSNQVLIGNLVGGIGRWTVMPPMPDSSSSTVMPIGKGMNSGGQVVGSAGIDERSGFIYKDGVTRDLNWLVDQSAGWAIGDARAINDSGQIAAIGSRGPSFGSHALLLTPVAPGDTTPPVVTVPSAPVVAEATGPGGAVVTFSASAVDPGNGPVPVTCLPASGSVFPLASTTVNCSASDAAGNVGRASFAVIVHDTTPPALSIPAGMSVDATSPGGAQVTFGASALDLVDGNVPVTCAPTSGSTFAIGDTTVSCSASDRSGNAVYGSFKIHVKGASEQLNDLLGEVTQNNLGPGHSLAAKLQAAIAAVSANNQAGACNTLQAFINEVQAQSGKKLTPDQAAQLISATNQIRSVLGC